MCRKMCLKIIMTEVPNDSCAGISVGVWFIRTRSNHLSSQEQRTAGESSKNVHAVESMWPLVVRAWVKKPSPYLHKVELGAAAFTQTCSHSRVLQKYRLC